MKIAYFISPHGYGHATRSIATMQALSKKNKNTEIIIITSLAEQLFQNCGIRYEYFSIVTDVGLFQYDAFREDIPKTIAALEQLLPFPDNLINEVAAICIDCDLIICDISILGIAVSNKTAIPSVLVENFTWDWIYQAYIKQFPKLKTYADIFRDYYLQADFHIQMQPVCCPDNRSDLIVAPVFRFQQREKTDLFTELPIGQRPVILITLGGITTDYHFIQRLTEYPDYFFIIPSAGDYTLTDNVLLLPVQNSYYHPDLIHGSDLVVCKTGYSTISEIYHSGVPLAYLGREQFAESKVIDRFIQDYLSGQKLKRYEFDNGNWLDHLPQLLQLERKPVISTNGADQLAEFLIEIIT